jgi:hypothetical protein
MTKRDDLMGSWHLARWDFTVDGEPRGFPMGEDARGQIVYASDGQMSAILCQADRPPFGVSQFNKGTEAERLRAAGSYINYAGSWDLADEVVTHHVEFCTFPDWVGTDLVREVSRQGDQLVLTTAPETTSAGATVVNRLFWRRPG